MRAFLRTSTSAASTSSSRVGQPTENTASCSVEQPAATFTTIAAVKRWLNGPMASSKAPCLQNMRAAVLVLTKTPNPRQAEVRSLCFAMESSSKRPATRSTFGDFDYRVAASGYLRRQQALRQLRLRKRSSRKQCCTTFRNN